MSSNEQSKTWDFDPLAARYDTLVMREAERIYARYNDVLDAVVTHAGIQPGMHVLEIGAGTGNLTQRILARGAHVIGVDPSQAMLAIAREKVGTDANLALRQLPQPFLELPFENETFDAVISSYAFHHIPQEHKAASLSCGLQVLKPGGMWVCGDIAFCNRTAEHDALARYDWLEEEYFTLLDLFTQICTELGLQNGFEAFADFVYVFWAKKSTG